MADGMEGEDIARCSGVSEVGEKMKLQATSQKTINSLIRTNHISS